MESLQNDLTQFGQCAYAYDVNMDELCNKIASHFKTRKEWKDGVEKCIKPYVLQGFPSRGQQLITMNKKKAKKLSDEDKRIRRNDMNRLNRILRNLYDKVYENTAPESEPLEPDNAAPESETLEPDNAAPESETLEPDNAAPESETLEPDNAAPESQTSEDEEEEDEEEEDKEKEEEGEEAEMEPIKGIEDNEEEMDDSSVKEPSDASASSSDSDESKSKKYLDIILFLKHFIYLQVMHREEPPKKMLRTRRNTSLQGNQQRRYMDVQKADGQKQDKYCTTIQALLPVIPILKIHFGENATIMDPCAGQGMNI